MSSDEPTSASGDSGEQRWSLSLIQTKMTPPRPLRGRVSRPELLARLGAARERHLTVVIAPAGFGKTTLLAEWSEELRAQRHVVAWLSLDGEDDDVQQFGAYVVASLQRAGEDIGRRAGELLRNDPLTPVKTVISVLLNEIGACGQHVFLILDDFDRITSTSLHAIAALLLRYAPDNFHVVLGVRKEPNLPLGALQTQERLLRLNAADLRFCVEDAQAFFAQAGRVALDRRSVELLNSATEGWVTGLQLASLTLREAGDAARVARDLASSAFGIDAYLQDAVLAQLPQPMIQFLLRTSILERLGADVCDAVMGEGARSWETLDWLEQHNVFIRPLDEGRRWFRYHALMSDTLRRRAARQLADELPTLHRRASRWFAAECLWPEAVRHALAAGEMQQAALWVENCAMTLIDHGDHRTLLGWIAKLPDELVNARLRLRLAKAWALTLSLHSAEAMRAVQAIAMDLARSQDSSEQLAGDGYATLPAEVDAVRAVIAGLMDDSARSLELGRIAASSPLSAPAWVRRFAETAQLFGLVYDGRFDEVRRTMSIATAQAGDGQPLYASVYRASMFGLSMLVEGRLPEAVQIFESALARAEAAVGRSSAAAVLPAGYLAALYYERNDLARVQDMVAGRTAIAMEACPLGSLLRYCQSAACLYARRGDVGSALMILEEVRQIGAAREWLRLRAGCDAESVRLYLREGRFAQAQQIADELHALMLEKLPSPQPSASMGSFLETWASYCIVQARLQIAHDRAEAAAALLDELRAKVNAAGMQHAEARVSVLLALALERASARDEALISLGRALHFAQRVGIISSFVDEGAALFALLQRWRRDAAQAAGIQPEFLQRLFAAFADSTTLHPPAVSAAPSELLSSREIEILEHISRGLSNKEIGRALRVAPETIKWHLKKVFEKLNVGSRIEAVQCGLGLSRIAASDAEASRSPTLAQTQRPQAR